MNERKSGHATGMAGEFYVMERLFRLGHEPAFILGNTKNIDILVATRDERFLTISVKAVQGGGKWPIGKTNYSTKVDLIFVFLLYNSFSNVTTDPDVWVMPAPHVELRKKPWIGGAWAVYYSHKSLVPEDLASYKNAWQNVA